MKDFIEISVDNIIKESKTKTPGYCDKQYIVYISPNDRHRKIHVNTYFYRVKSFFSLQKIKIRLCIYYDRALCETLEEYHRLPVEYIEKQAYCSWMDGAR